VHARLATEPDGGVLARYVEAGRRSVTQQAPGYPAMQSPTRQRTPPKRLRPSREGGSRCGDGAQIVGEECGLTSEMVDHREERFFERVLGLVAH
jgi:hypothetical protein